MSSVDYSPHMYGYKSWADIASELNNQIDSKSEIFTYSMSLRNAPPLQAPACLGIQSRNIVKLNEQTLYHTGES
jgi:hypothetical protein